MMSNGMLAKLVWDGTDEVRIPSELGTPREDQMQGTAAERLSELAGRSCYDSLGTGRPSIGYREQLEPCEGEGPQGGYRDHEGYHEHIAKVNHGSVWEHPNYTAWLQFKPSETVYQSLLECIWACTNRPGVIVLPEPQEHALRITANVRSIVEWDAWTERFYAGYTPEEYAGETVLALGRSLKMIWNERAPHIVKQYDWLFDPPQDALKKIEFDEPSNDHEKWISLFMQGSRGFSHEQVRHGDFTAISQRSTRFVDENATPWVTHPLLQAYMSDPALQDQGELLPSLRRQIVDCLGTSRDLYKRVVGRLQPWLEARGVDKTNARKQARGAARGFLGNALQTEMIFSASVAQWKIMLGQRASQFADAEIREVYAAEKECVLEALKTSRYANCFEKYSLEPSPDGIGQVAKLSA